MDPETARAAALGGAFVVVGRKGVGWHHLLLAEIQSAEFHERAAVAAIIGATSTNDQFAILYGDSANWTGDPRCLYCPPPVADDAKPYSRPVIASHHVYVPPRATQPSRVSTPRQSMNGPRWPQRGYRR